jgi:hypothetical protein
VRGQGSGVRGVVAFPLKNLNIYPSACHKLGI